MEKMKDTIYRLDTLNAIDDYFNPNHNTDELPAPLTEFLIAVGVIISLQPSAQPEINCSEFPNNSDTIGRQDAVSRQRLLSGLKELITAWEKYPVMAEQIKGVEVAIGYVETIPSVQPERKRGKWLELTNTNHTYICSVCGRMLVNITDGKNMVMKNYPFCHCGADMRGEQDEMEI